MLTHLESIPELKLNERGNMKKLYIIKCNNYYKVGISKNTNDRIQTLQVGNPYELTVEGVYNVTNAATVEASVHEKLNGFKVRGEWFNCPMVRVSEACEEALRHDKEHIKGDIEITEKILGHYLTKGCGMSRTRARVIGINWPLKRGWKKKVIGRTIPLDAHNIMMGR